MGIMNHVLRSLEPGIETLSGMVWVFGGEWENPWGDHDMRSWISGIYLLHEVV